MKNDFLGAETKKMQLQKHQNRCTKMKKKISRRNGTEKIKTRSVGRQAI